MKALFGLGEDDPEEKETCKDCVHRERWATNTRVIQYCRAIKSNRTVNGLLKIKCKNKACGGFQKSNRSAPLQVFRSFFE